MVSTFGKNISVSRINRLLRPLRNKCANLASLASSSSSNASLVTYGSRSATGTPDEHPPLAILLSPKALASRAHLDHHSLENLELSRRVYAVLDTFKNVLQAHFGSGSVGKEVKIMSLTDMCAAVVGESIQDDIELSLYEDRDESCDVDEDAEMAIMNECYEAVSEQYRGWTLVSHALSIVMKTCPHQPTLVSCLLDMSLSYNLPRESKVILRALLATAICAGRPSASRPICHPAHSSYLRELCLKWTSFNLSKDHGSHQPSHYTETGFVTILVDVLVEMGSADVWNSKAISRLGRHMQATDFPAFVQLLCGLAEVTSRRSRRKKMKRKRGKVPDGESEAENIQLCDRLSRWTTVLHSRVVLLDLDHDLLLPAQQDEFASIVDYLVTSRALGIHLCDDDAHSESPFREVQDVLACLATQCLASPLLASRGAHDVEELVSLLRDAHPVTSTYDDLVIATFAPEEPAGSPVRPVDRSLLGAMRSLRRYASALHEHDLRALEASFWACALRHFERDVSVSSAAGGRENQRIRYELMDEVNIAERRFYGSRSSRHGSSSNENEDASDGLEGSEWEWEDLFGCWVRKSPPAKQREMASTVRPRTRLSTGSQPLRAPALIRTTSASAPPRTAVARRSVPVNPTSSRKPVSMTSTSTSTSATISISSDSSTHSRSISPDTEISSDEDKDEEDEGDSYEDFDEILAPKKPRREWNFRTLVADAQKNVINLREEKAAERAAAARRAASQTRNLGRGVGRDQVRRQSAQNMAQEPSSDDVLDLLA